MNLAGLYNAVREFQELINVPRFSVARARVEGFIMMYPMYPKLTIISHVLKSWQKTLPNEYKYVEQK